MGVLNAMQTAVSGLSAQSYALENISGNIANSQTVGFKRVDTSFVDMIPDSAARREVAGSVAAFSQLTNTLQGAPRTTGVTTNMAINGGGFFVVQNNSGSISSPIFAGQDLYTRRGDFAPDASGYLVNGAGKYLIGNQTGGGSGPVKISSSPIPAKPSSTITYQANLPSLPKTANQIANAAVAGSELLSGNGPSGASLTGATIIGTDRDAFEARTIPGGEVTVYNAAGTPTVMQTRWGKTANAAGATQDTWQLYYQTSNSTGAAAAYEQVGGPVTFSASGQLTSTTSATINPLTVNGQSMGTVNLNFGTGTLTQYGDTNGQISNGEITQNGYTTGSLNSISVSTDGQIIGNYSNGEIQTLAQVQIAHFKAEDQLKRIDGGVYSQTIASGTPSYGLQGSSLSAGSVEQSNTDIAEEFSKMIVTQQAYSANTRVISTAQQMLSDVINVIR